MASFNKNFRVNNNLDVLGTGTSSFAGPLTVTGIVTGTTFAGSGASLTNIPNGALTNSAVTIGSTAVSLGAAITAIIGLTSVTSTTFVGSLTGSASQLNGQAASYYLDLANAAGTLAVARLPALTGGDVTSTAGSSTLTIGAGTVTLAKMANLAATSIMGNNTGSAAVPLALTPAQVRAMLNVSDGATANSGTVTSVSMTVPTGLSIAGSPVTTSGTLAVTYTAGYQGYTTTEANKLAGIASGATANTGTVTSVSVTTANGVSGSVATATTTPAITLTLGAITPTSVNGLTLAALGTGFTVAGGTVSKTLTVTDNASISGTNTGDQTTISGNAGTATTLATARNIGFGTGPITATAQPFNGSTAISIPVTSFNLADAAMSGILSADHLGTGTANNTTFLRGDNTWATPTASAAWGSITGTLSAQTDLQSALDLKADYNITLIAKGLIPNAADLDTYLTTGLFHQNTNAQASAGTNYPAPVAGMLEVFTSGVMTYQKYQEYASGQSYTRSKYNTVWSAWNKVWSDQTGTLPFANGTDILQVAGGAKMSSGPAGGTLRLHAGASGAASAVFINFAGTETAHMSETGLTMFTPITGTTAGFSGAVTATSFTATGNITSSQNFISTSGVTVLACTGAGQVNLRPNGSGSSTGQLQVLSTGAVTVNGSLTVTGAITSAGNAVWHDANAFTAYANDTDADNITIQGGWGVRTTTGINHPTSYVTTVNLHTRGAYGIQLSASYGGSQGFYIRSKYDLGGFKPWATIWTSETDGAGSGLDADTVDGVQLSGLMQTAWTITAGNGLTGGGSGAADRTLTLGTPGTITGVSTNSVTATSHTHDIALPFLYNDDDRGVRTTPATYVDRGLSVAFSDNASSGLGSTYAMTLHLAPWTAFNAAYKQQQLGFRGDGNSFSWRVATSDTAWGPWYKVHTDASTDIDAATLGGRAFADAATGTTIAGRDANGDIHARLFRSTYATANANTAFFMTQVNQGADNYIRPSSLAQVSTSLRGLSTPAGDLAYDYPTGRWLRWQNYGNGHIIFDASQGTSPTGTAVNNTNSAAAWSATYPTLMGWNGSSTYGVRVDSARTADTLQGYAPQVAVGGSTIVLRHASGYIFANYFNCSADITAASPTAIMVETGGDGYIRKQTLASLRTNLNTGLVTFTAPAGSGDASTAISINGTSPQIRFSDTDNATDHWIHCNTNQFGFLANNAFAWAAYRDASNNWACTGNITAYASDRRLKKNIKDVSLARVNDVFARLRIREYDWDAEAIARHKVGFEVKLNQVGGIAQEVQEVFPDAVTVNGAHNPIPTEENPNPEKPDFLTIQWEKFVPLLIAKVQEQDQRIAELEALINTAKITGTAS